MSYLFIDLLLVLFLLKDSSNVPYYLLSILSKKIEKNQSKASKPKKNEIFAASSFMKKAL